VIGSHGGPRILALALAAACGCHSVNAEGADWLDPAPAPEITGTAVQTGASASLRGLRGRVVMLSFGYTHCADICPVTMKTMSDVLRELGAEASQVAPVYVSIDPTRDSTDRLRAFLEPYDDRIDAWLVPPAPLRGALRSYDVSATRRPVTLRRYVGQELDPRHDYSLDHTGGVWIIDRRGSLRAHFLHGSPAAAIAAGIRRLMAEAPLIGGA